MTNILVVTGSVRPNSINQKIVPEVTKVIEEKNATPLVADLGELNMPFFDAPMPPTAPNFEAPHESVKQWTKLVADADGVIFVTPEYNHTLSPLQINAIDWIGKEWQSKPVGLVGYGFTSGAGQAHATAREALAVNLKAKIGDQQTNLFIGKDLNMDGSIANAEQVHSKITQTVTELLEAIS